MNRSGYIDDCENINLWRGAVDRAIEGKRGQAFLRELADVMDAMPNKRLIYGELVTLSGEVCAIGAVCKARGLDTSAVDLFDAYHVGEIVGIAGALAAEIEWINDEANLNPETPEQRWFRVRSWVQGHLKK